MTGGPVEVAAEDLESRMLELFGADAADYNSAHASSPVPTAYLTSAIRIVDKSGVVDKLEEWRTTSRKSNAGRKAYIPFRAVLVLFLLHAQMNLGLQYQDLADTLHHRFGIKEFKLLGITDAPGDRTDWYKRIWDASNRMLSHLDPYPVRRNKRLGPKAYQKLVAKQNKPKARKSSELKLRRLDWICEQLVHTSIAVLPRRQWEKYQGNISIDATLIEISGKPNPTSSNYRRGNADPTSGRYRRGGKHDGRGKKNDKAGYELELAVMVWNKPGEKGLFPSLATAVSFHRPGEIVGEGLKLIKSHKSLGFDRFLALADRAYNNAKAENFQIPARKLGVEFVFDYKDNNLGLQGHYGDLILVDGNWYIKHMPQHLIDAAKDYADKKIDKATFKQYIQNRAPYRALPKGRPDADGFQRFTLPEPGTYMAIDRATGKRIPRPTERGSVTLPPSLKQSDDKRETDPAKHVQKFPYKTKTWQKHYGMRNLVETKNKESKRERFAFLGDKGKRSGRGYTFNYIAATVAIVASNLRKIAKFFVKAEEKEAEEEGTRARRRKDPSGTPLARLTMTLPLAPPR